MTSGGAEPDSFRPGRYRLEASGRTARAARRARRVTRDGRVRSAGQSPPVTSPTGPAPGTRRPRDPAVPAHAHAARIPRPGSVHGTPAPPRPASARGARARARPPAPDRRRQAAPARAARRRTCARPAHSVSAPPSRTNDSSTPAVASKNARPIPTDRLEAVRRRIRHQRLADGGPAVAAALVAVPGTAAPKVFSPGLSGSLLPYVL